MTLIVEAAAAVRSASGFRSCGDAALVLRAGDCTLLAVVDALGHGPEAAASAARVEEVMRTHLGRPLAEVFTACDRALARLRSVVISAVRLGPGGAVFAGVGNVEIVGPKEAAHPAAVAGTVGRGIRRYRETTLPAEAGHRWMLASDGLRPRSLRKAMEDTRQQSPAAAADRVLALAGRDDDDASVLVMDFSEVG